MSELVKVRDRNRVRLLTLNRPDALNAFNDDVYDAATAALKEAAAAPDLAVVVITGQDRAFSAGQDLGELGSPRLHDDGLRHGFQPFIEVVEAFPKPLIAAVNGIGVGIGLTLLPHCDMVLMAEEARLKAPFVDLGVTTEAGSSFLLPAMIGWAATAHILYTAPWIDADYAVEIGLAWRQVPDEQLMEETMEMAEFIAQNPIPSLVATKQLLLAARLDATRHARERENEAFGRLVGAPANREAIAAFKEKRPADFTRLPAE
ncbi:MAG: enoyl-CoA hydratase/isomerase family protein [Rhodospirillaceae bacterium]|nr:enoyl-CoA hydratase/isomerase family protein [Rhodospirillaceae bacterium]